jgi:hypothetical protein
MEIPYWCSESPITGTYVATACPHHADNLSEPVTNAAKFFAQATDNFIRWTQEEPVRLDRLNFTQATAWHGLAGQLVTRYHKSHWELINSDSDYRDGLGEAYDMYSAAGSTTPRKHSESPVTRRRRHIFSLHTMVKEATTEGIPTSLAAFAVVPDVVGLRRPTITPKEQIIASKNLLPAGAELSRHLARNSKHGNERLLRALAGVARSQSIPYARLSYAAEAFTVGSGENGKDQLQTVGTHKEPVDLTLRFRSCPAILYGGIRKLNALFMTIITNHELYERHFASGNLIDTPAHNP